jgi:hypothetical protein
MAQELFIIAFHCGDRNVPGLVAYSDGSHSDAGRDPERGPVLTDEELKALLASAERFAVLED